MAKKNARCALPYKKAISQRTSLSGEPAIGFYIYLAFLPVQQATLPALLPFTIQVACQNYGVVRKTFKSLILNRISNGEICT